MLYLGFAHIWLVGFRKQLKFAWIRKNALYIVLTGAFLFMITYQSVFLLSSEGNSIRWWDLILGIIGAFGGIGTFKLLYRTCS